jgi:hypothetical protein
MSESMSSQQTVKKGRERERERERERKRRFNLGNVLYPKV